MSRQESYETELQRIALKLQNIGLEHAKQIAAIDLDQHLAELETARVAVETAKILNQVAQEQLKYVKRLQDVEGLPPMFSKPKDPPQ